MSEPTIQEQAEIIMKMGHDVYCVMHKDAAKLVSRHKIVRKLKEQNEFYNTYWVGTTMQRYQLQLKHYEDMWRNLDGELFYVKNVAIMRAEGLAKKSIAYSVIRIFDLQTGDVVHEVK